MKNNTPQEKYASYLNWCNTRYGQNRSHLSYEDFLKWLETKEPKHFNAGGHHGGHGGGRGRGRGWGGYGYGYGLPLVEVIDDTVSLEQMYANYVKSFISSHGATGKPLSYKEWGKANGYFNAAGMSGGAPGGFAPLPPPTNPKPTSRSSILSKANTTTTTQAAKQPTTATKAATAAPLPPPTTNVPPYDFYVAPGAGFISGQGYGGGGSGGGGSSSPEPTDDEKEAGDSAKSSATKGLFIAAALAVVTGLIVNAVTHKK